MKATKIAVAVCLAWGNVYASEQSLSVAQDKVGARYAYTNNARGKGVVVAVLDSGLDVRYIGNTELKNRIVTPYNAVTNSTTNLMTDTVGHGTGVAGVIAAARDNYGIYGVAPEAYIMPIKVFETLGSTEANIVRGLNYAISNKAFVINMSMGSPVSTVGMQTAIKNAVNSGQLVVAAAGNTGASSPEYPAGYANQAWARGQIIAVGAVDATNKITPYSNRAGSAKDFYLVGYGNNVATTYTSGRYAYMSGTSFATPQVTGAAAVVKGNWNYLTAPQVAQVLFRSATRLGTATATVSDPTYGWGLVNLQAALRPIGAVRAVTGRVGVAATMPMSTLTNLSKVASQTRLSSVNVVVLDDLDRGFNYNLEGTTVDTSRVSDLFTSLNETPMYEKVTPTAKYVSNGYATAFLLNTDTATYGVGKQGFVDSYFGLSSTKLGSTNYNAPYMGLVKSANFGGYGFKFDNKVIRVGVLSNTLKTGTVLELQADYKDVVAVMSYGTVTERKGFLGVDTVGLYATPTATTQYVALAAGMALDTNTTLAGMVSMGVTPKLNGSDNFFSTSTLVSKAWSFGVSKAKVLTDADKVSVTLMSPMTVVKGQFNITSAVAQSQEDGSLTTGTQVVSLDQKAPINLELRYSSKITTLSKLDAAMTKTQTGYIVGAMYKVQF